MNLRVLSIRKHTIFYPRVHGFCIYVRVNSRFQSRPLGATRRSSPYLLVSNLWFSRSPSADVRRPLSKQSTRTRKRTCRPVTLVSAYNTYEVTNYSTGPNAQADGAHILTALKPRTATVVVLDFDPFVVHGTRVGCRTRTRHANGLQRRAAPSIVHHLHHSGQQFRVFVRYRSATLLLRFALCGYGIMPTQ